MGHWTNKRVLITGAGGFIGSHLAEHLAHLGARVRALVRYNGRNDWGALEFLDDETRGALEVTSGDIRDGGFMQKAMRDREVVFHLAALIAIPYSYAAPQSYVDTNVGGTLNVLQAAREVRPERIVVTSTSEVYGTARYVPIDEDHPLHPQSPYAATKVGADKLAESFHSTYGLRITIIRPFNTYGARQSARAVIPTIITQALAGRSVRLGMVDTVRDVMLAQDTVRGFLSVTQASSTVGEVVNIGTGIGVSVRDLVNRVGGILDKDLELITDGQRLRPDASEVGTLIASFEKARTLAGWAPHVGLDEGLRRTVEWLAAHTDHYKPALYNI